MDIGDILLFGGTFSAVMNWQQHNLAVKNLNHNQSNLEENIERYESNLRLLRENSILHFTRYYFGYVGRRATYRELRNRAYKELRNRKLRNPKAKNPKNQERVN